MSYYTILKQNIELQQGFELAVIGLSERARLICQFANEKRVIQNLKNKGKW